MDASASIKEIIFEISNKRLGVTAVIDHNKIVGIITDGDIRRMLEKTTELSAIKANELMSTNPKTISIDAMVVDALNILESNKITQLVVMQDDEYKGIIHLHDILKEGIVS